MSRFIKFEIDLDNLPPLTQEQREEIRALAKLPDNCIDFRDIPPLDDSFWRKAANNKTHLLFC